MLAIIKILIKSKSFFIFVFSSREMVFVINLSGGLFNYFNMHLLF